MSGDDQDDDDWAGKGYRKLEIEDAAACPNCGGKAEPEQEDDVLFYACGCGNYFGYRTVQQDEDTCAAGLPFAKLAESQLDDGTKVFIGTIGRRPA